MNMSLQPRKLRALSCQQRSILLKAKIWLKNELAQLKGAHAKLVAENRKKEFAEFCDSLINQGKLAADQKEATIAIMMQLDNGNAAEFSDGTKQNALDVFKAQLETRTPVVEFSEIMTHDRVGSGGQDTNSFAALGKSIAETVNPKNERAAGNGLKIDFGIKEY